MVKICGIHTKCWSCDRVTTYKTLDLNIRSMFDKYRYCTRCNSEYRTVTLDFIKERKVPKK